MKNEFTITESTQMSEYEGKTYAFCCPGCKPQFDADPPKYL
ncbi:MAG: YHS domain-containing protein [Deltaproteobacteria bacterium]|nr:YHS domain-containing protein [Deltaproteobacteria bacterium]MBN2671729.1 YHS domain-containing protein [Deltaproteobacteria bacterium]